MRYKQKRRIKLIIILAIMAFAAFLYFQHGINLGLDLQGGAHIVLQAQPTEEREINDTVMSGIQSVIERRVNQLGLTEPLIQRQGSDRIIVELPAVDSPNEAINTIGRTAMLTFRNSAGEVLMTGEAVKDARADHDQYGRPVIAFTLTDEGSKQFANITRQYIGEKIGIYLDDEITGYESIQAAEEDAILIREGALPVPVEVIETRTVGPTLGSISIQKSIKAGLIGLLLVAIYMVFYYRFPGVLAAVILAIYGLILMGTMAGLQATLTLPGIAGLILSIGMAVDANIIIFERIKDELKSGKTLRAAIDSGFKRAYTTIIDANVTTIMTALILASKRFCCNTWYRYYCQYVYCLLCNKECN
jgi:preprotein translocase subunit SecD